ncbi:MAG: hypothetical protein EBX49_01135 [Synechococcaceae bacterium WB8_1B_136]|nr:hypothetical protein [Synechococcaceae bacterium WB8_1B_136]
MAWDPTLLRKYNATGHFRLLNQVRNELKEQPIQRPLVTSRSPSNRSGLGRSLASRGDTGRGQATAGGRRRSPATTIASASPSSSVSASVPAPEASAALFHDAFVMVPVLTDTVLEDSYSS